MSDQTASVTPTHYPVSELFETIQGEGFFTGVPSVFLRLQGCPVGCPWCDTQHTWHVREQDRVAPELVLNTNRAAISRWSNFSVEQLIKAIGEKRFSARHLVITGGEPCMYDLRPLTEAMSGLGWRCQIETSGCFDIKVAESAWVTVSPKVAMKGGYEVRTSALNRADEIKFPVAMTKHIDQLDALLAELPQPDKKVIALQPISQSERATKLCINTCIERNWRLSIQAHKYLNID